MAIANLMSGSVSLGLAGTIAAWTTRLPAWPDAYRVIAPARLGAQLDD